jgi:hypothetical protein
MNRHLSNEGQERKTGHVKGRAVMGGRGINEEDKVGLNMVDALSTRVNMEQWSL